MRVRWTPAAADDFENIANYLFEQTPENAARLIREIYLAPKGLESFPKRGRVGKRRAPGRTGKKREIGKLKMGGPAKDKPRAASGADAWKAKSDPPFKICSAP